jgi:hypothetical protein
MVRSFETLSYLSEGAIFIYVVRIAFPVLGTIADDVVNQCCAQAQTRQITPCFSISLLKTAYTEHGVLMASRVGSLSLLCNNLCRSGSVRLVGCWLTCLGLAVLR